MCAAPQMSCSLSLVILLLCAQLFKLADLPRLMSPSQHDLLQIDEVALAVAMMIFILSAFFLVGVLIGLQAYLSYLKDKQERKWAVPTLDPPYFQWRPKRGLYTCFLSHYKMEVGSDARYLSDLLRKMLRCPAFLDSSTLSDLRTLFSNGIAEIEP